MRLVGTKVLINTLPDGAETRYKGAIVLPDTARGFSTHGIIEAVGPHVRTVIPGEWVLINRKFAHALPNDERRIIIDEHYLVAVMALDSEVRITVTVVDPLNYRDAALVAALTAANMVVFHVEPDSPLADGITAVDQTEALVIAGASTKAAFLAGYAMATKKPIWVPPGMPFVQRQSMERMATYTSTEDLIAQLTSTLRKAD